MQGSQPLSLRRNFSWTFLGNIVYAGCQWGMLVVLAKLGRPEMVGQFTLGLAVTAPIILFCNLQLRQIQATDSQQTYSFQDYWSLRIVTTFIACLIILGVALMNHHDTERVLVILLVGASKAIEALSDVLYGWLQQRERMDQLAHSTILHGMVTLGALGITVAISGNLVLGLVGLLVGRAFVLVINDISVCRKLGLDTQAFAIRSKGDRPGFQTFLSRRVQTVFRLLRITLPMGLVMMLISLNTNIPRYFIEAHVGSRELGIFAAMAYLQVVGTTLVSALGQSASPRLAQYHHLANHRAFKQLMVKLMSIAVGIGSLGVVIAQFYGKELLSMIYSSEFAEHSDIFVWLMVATGLLYVVSFLGYAATAQRKIRLQPVVLLTSVASSLVACQLLVPNYGLTGAAIATIITSTAMTFGYIVLLVFG
jgi:O-antigen/teichoic acid export membrane protein